MTILEKYEERVYNGTESDMKTRHIYLAYLLLHMENPALHPDDYQTVDGGYKGWQVLLVHQVLHGNTSIPDNIQYPTAFLKLQDALEIFDDNCDNDEEHMLINTLFNFVVEMAPTELEEAVDCLQKLYLMNADENQTAEEEAETPCGTIKEAADILTWIIQRP